MLRFDALIREPAATLATIQEFLGVPHWEPPEFRNHSYTSSGATSYPPPPDEVHEFLATRFAAPNAELVELLGEEYRWDVPASR